MLDDRLEADRILTAQLTGTAKRHARWRDLTEAEHAAAVAELRGLAGFVNIAPDEGPATRPRASQAADIEHEYQ